MRRLKTTFTAYGLYRASKDAEELFEVRTGRQWVDNRCWSHGRAGEVFQRSTTGGFSGVVCFVERAAELPLLEIEPKRPENSASRIN